MKHNLFITLGLWSGLLLLTLLTHYHAIGIFYVQDDAYAWLGSAGVNLAEGDIGSYNSITTALQYRPNAWVLTHLLDIISPDAAWPLRVAGMVTIFLTGIMGFYTTRVLSNNNYLAAITSILLVVHPGFYSYATLYLSAVMTGLGLLLVFAGVMAAYHLAQKYSHAAYGFTLIFLVFALTSYETAIMILPMMMGVDYLYSQKKCLKRTLMRYIPHIVITLGYLYARKLGIEASVAENTAGHYEPTLKNVIGNAFTMIQHLFGIPLIGFTKTVKIMTIVVSILTLLLSFFYARKNNHFPLWIGAWVWIILGIAPFTLIGGIALHYIVYAVPGFALLLAMSVHYLYQKQKIIGCITFFALLAAGIAINDNAYQKRILTSMAYTGKNLVNEFEKAKTDNKNIVMMNMNNHMAWRIHFGNSINIAHRSDPYTINFPQGEWPVVEMQNPQYLYVTVTPDDPENVSNQIIDVTKWVDETAKWTNIRPVISTNKGQKALDITTKKDGSLILKAKGDLDFIEIGWTPLKANMPYTISFETVSPEKGRIESTWYDQNGKPIKCYAETPATQIAVPPKKWSARGKIAFSQYGIKKGEIIILKNARVKKSFDMLTIPYRQICDRGMFNE